jgi:hypothetical protein
VNDSTSAIEETITLAVPPDGGAETAAPQPDLRDAMLSGRFLGLQDRAIEDALTAFLAGDNDAALALWLPEGWSGSADDVRGLLDRDIVAIDAMLSEQLDAILHHDRLRRLEGTWRGLGSRPKSSISVGPKSAATWNARSNSTRAICFEKFTKKNSACPAASRTA